MTAQSSLTASALFLRAASSSGWLDFDDLFEARRSSLQGRRCRSRRSVFALQVGGAGKDLLLVFEDGFDIS